MGRLSAIVRLAFITVVISLVAALSSCSSSSPTKNTDFPVPANIVLSPANTVSLDVGSANQTFTAIPQNRTHTTITTPVAFLSSNTAILTVANNGLACAGTWDSLATPQICTPGPVGVVQVTATSHGVSSPPTTVYVHQHVDKITVSPIPGQTPPAGSCFSKGQAFDYQATAFSHGLDITASVGTFDWQSITTGVATLAAATASAPVTGLVVGQARATANTPGITSLFVSNDNVTSQPLDFITCQVQSIALTVNESASNSVNVNSGTGQTVTATVVDTQGNTITGVPLTWSSSNPSTVAVSATGAITTTQAGGGTVVASCTPPTCNIGLQPLLPIYPESAVNVVVAPATSTTTTASTTTPTVYVSSTGISSSPAGNCATATGCTSLLIPIASPNDTVGSPVGLPATPNSLVFDRQGVKAYMGTDFSFFGSRGLMAITFATPPTVAEFKSVTGKVLTVSPDGKKVILSGVDPNAVPAPGSNTPPAPTQVIVFDTGASTGTTLPIAGATAADFSPDNLRAFIAAGSALYVYSAQDSLKTIPLTAPAKVVSFSPEGAFAFVSGGSSASSVTAWSTCGRTPALTNTVVLPATPAFLQALGTDAPNLPIPTFASPTTITSILAVDSPGIDLFRVARAPTGCSSAATAGAATSFNLGQGSFVPTQLIVSQDESRAYVIVSDRGAVLVFNIGSQTSSAIPLAGDAIPVRASLTSDGTRLYIAATDGQVHILDTQSGADIQQLSFPSDAATLLSGLCSGVTFTCNPDLIAVKP